MATDPSDIRLSPAHKELLAARAAETGKAWSEVFSEAMELWQSRRTAISAALAGLHQADQGELADGDAVLDRMMDRARHIEAAARKA